MKFQKEILPGFLFRTKHDGLLQHTEPRSPTVSVHPSAGTPGCSGGSKAQFLQPPRQTEQVPVGTSAQSSRLRQQTTPAGALRGAPKSSENRASKSSRPTSSRQLDPPSALLGHRSAPHQAPLAWRYSQARGAGLTSLLPSDCHQWRSTQHSQDSLGESNRDSADQTKAPGLSRD